jgi:hypothetical protein
MRLYPNKHNSFEWLRLRQTAPEDKFITSLIDENPVNEGTPIMVIIPHFHHCLHIY